MGCLGKSFQKVDSSRYWFDEFSKMQRFGFGKLSHATKNGKGILFFTFLLTTSVFWVKFPGTKLLCFRNGIVLL